MFERFLLKVLGGYLSYYLSNFDADSFSLGLLNGEISLADVGMMQQQLVTLRVVSCCSAVT